MRKYLIIKENIYLSIKQNALVKHLTSALTNNFNN